LAAAVWVVRTDGASVPGNLVHVYEPSPFLISFHASFNVLPSSDSPPNNKAVLSDIFVNVAPIRAFGIPSASVAAVGLIGATETSPFAFTVYTIPSPGFILFSSLPAAKTTKSPFLPSLLNHTLAAFALFT
jgi:hypothetical protein